MKPWEILGSKARKVNQRAATQVVKYARIRIPPMVSAKSNVAIIEAKPQPITIEIPKTAVIVVDMQNDFGSKGGMFDRAGLDISMIQSTVRPTSRVLGSARQRGIAIVYLKMGFRPDLSDLGDLESPNRTRHLHFGVGQKLSAPDGSEGRMLIRDTWNTDIVSDLKPKNEDRIVYKNRFSGFFETELHDILKRLGIKYLIITGCTTSVCVESTVRDAMFRDYSCLLLADCMGEPIGNGLPRSNHEASLLTMQTLFGWVSNSEEFVKSLRLKQTAITETIPQ
jgi:ureidoacrylate peracid hydrolase